MTAGGLTFPTPPEGYFWVVECDEDMICIAASPQGDSSLQPRTCRIRLEEFRKNPQRQIDSVCDHLTGSAARHANERAFVDSVRQAAVNANKNA